MRDEYYAIVQHRRKSEMREFCNFTDIRKAKYGCLNRVKYCKGLYDSVM